MRLLRRRSLRNMGAIVNAAVRYSLFVVRCSRRPRTSVETRLDAAPPAWWRGKAPSPHLLQMVERPLGMFGDDWVCVPGKFLQRRHELLIAAVPHGDYGIAAQAGKFRASHRRSAEDGTEFFRLHFGQPV